MKEIKHYMCEYCHTEYTNIDEAQMCEKSHNTPKEIIGAVYNSIDVEIHGYPVAVLIRMSDGVKVSYKLQKVKGR